jgi:hypothetical protein
MILKKKLNLISSGHFKLSSNQNDKILFAIFIFMFKFYFVSLKKRKNEMTK